MITTVKWWTSQAIEDLHSCFDITDWDVFKEESDVLNENINMSLYVSFSGEICIPVKQRMRYNNDKLWF